MIALPRFRSVFTSAASGLACLAVALLMTERTTRTRRVAERDVLTAHPRGTRDSVRAALLYVSNDSSDHPEANQAAAAERRAQIEELYRRYALGRMRFDTVRYISAVDSLSIPAYLFRPLTSDAGLARAFVWLHGDIHGYWDDIMLPFVLDAIARGYAVLAPNYRGSSGYGKAYYDAVDYGGRELSDIASAIGYLRTVPDIDASAPLLMGWSHGGYIVTQLLSTTHSDYVAGIAVAPPTNLLLRMAYHGPVQERYMATQPGFGGLPFERPYEYIARSPVYRIDSLHTPLMVQFATNDADVPYIESELFIAELSLKKRSVATSIVYEDPPGGHMFNRLVNRETFERRDSPAQAASWQAIWQFARRYSHVR